MTTAMAEKNKVPTIDELIVGKSAAIQELRKMIARVAKSSASVMLLGASGSGKEMVARAIHAASSRGRQDLVTLNCGAIPAELIESELFGHERGSFTGAHSRRVGRFEEAHRSTLFLDEIGDMRFDMQVKLLRVLEEGKVTRVGANTATTVDVRVVSATHQDIDKGIDLGRFREDLYFRLGVVIIQVPDLASRAEDIPLLIKHFQKGKPAGAIARFDASAMDYLLNYAWPGNVRELRNLVERAGVLHGSETVGLEGVERLLDNKARRMTSGRELRAQQIPSTRTTPEPSAPAAPAPVRAVADPSTPIDLKEILEAVELERIEAALNVANGVISEAARLLTLKRTTLIEKMRKYGVARQC